jgi:hypothetical protein
MDRYQIAIDKRDLKPRRFQPTSSVKKVGEYLHYCIKNKWVFSSKNIAAAVIEVALIKISLAMSVPIIVDSEKTAQLLSMTYSHQFYTKDNLITVLPLLFFANVICYNCPEVTLPPGITVLLTVSNI